jgi:hypothetical protein
MILHMIIEEKRIWTQPGTPEWETHSTVTGNIFIKDTAFILSSDATHLQPIMAVFFMKISSLVKGPTFPNA